MRDCLTPSHIANQVKMTASQHKGVFLIVEGSTDARIYESFVDTRTCIVVVGHNKSNVLGAVELLANSGFLQALGIVDSDFWKLQSISSPCSNVFVTDTHDLETMMLKTAALDKVLRELSIKRKLASFEKSRRKCIRDVLLDAAVPVGLARWISERDRLALKFRDIDFTLFIDINFVKIDLDAMVGAILHNTNSLTVSRSRKDLRDQITREQYRASFDPWHVCCGHDLMSVFSIALQKAVGTRNSVEVSREILERHLRLAYEFEFFKSSQLYRSLYQWQTSNKPYKVLRD